MTGRSAVGLRLLYVAGLPRSGSTVLGYVLGALPGAIFAGELAFFWRRFAAAELCSCGRPLPDCDFWSAVVVKAFGGPMTREDARELAKLERQVIERQRLLGLLPVRWSTRWSQRIQLMLGERARLYRSIGEIANAEYIVDSGKEVTFGAMMARLDSAKFSTIHLVRDPRGVAFSWQKQIRSDSESGHMPRRPPVKTAVRWLSGNLLVQLSLKPLSSAYSRVRYEDLVAAPDEIVREISAAISGQPGSSRPADHPVQHLNEHHLVASNPGVRRRLESADLRLVLDEEWRTRLPRAQQLLVMAVCGGLMVAYDYPLRRRL